jgi:hypothetical protein
MMASYRHKQVTGSQRISMDDGGTNRLCAEECARYRQTYAGAGLGGCAFLPSGWLFDLFVTVRGNGA